MSRTPRIMHSYVSTPNTDPFLYTSPADMLGYWAGVDPSRDAVVFYNLYGKRQALTRKELLGTSMDLARKFVRMGARKGDVIGLCMTNSMNNVICFMAIQLSGCIPLSTTFNLKDGSDVRTQMEEVGVKILIMDAEDSGSWSIVENIATHLARIPSTTSSLKYIICNGTLQKEFQILHSLEDVMQEKLTEEFLLPEVKPESLFAYFLSSGSTGNPKIIGTSNFTILNFSKMMNDNFGIGQESVYFCERPVGWQLGCLRTYLASGSTRVFVHPKMVITGEKVEFLCKIIQEEKCTHLYLPGYLVCDLLEDIDRSRFFSSVDAVICAGERIPKHYTKLLQGFCRKFFVLYGTTEAGGHCTFTHDDPEMYEDGIIGKPLPGYEMKLIGKDGEVVPQGSVGELLVRTNMRFVEYWKRPDLFAKSIDKQNWFHTGDLAHIRADGNFVMEGREKDVITIGTVKYLPGEIEQILGSLPNAKAVFAVGVPDDRLGQAVCACVVPDDDINMTSEDVRLFCDKLFTEEKTTGMSLKPKYHLVMKEIPVLTSMGKVDRKTLTKLAKEMIGLR